MGLDITVYKVYKPENEDVEDFYILSEFPKLEVFSNLAFEKSNSYYNTIKELQDLGYNLEDLIQISIERGKNTKFEYRNIKHQLYPVYEFLNKVWHKCYSNSLFQLKNTQEWQEFKQNYRDLLINSGWKEYYKHKLARSKRNKACVYTLVNAWKYCDKKTKVTLINPSLIIKRERCIAIKEVGYQRKGANKQFFDDNMWNSPCILDLNTLNQHKEKYFTDTYQKNIIDNFIEGETFVIYH